MDLIIGAGITGLSYAAFCNHKDYILIEREKEIGGYCKTTVKNGFVWDYSGHFFHFKDKSIKDFVMKNMNMENIVEVTKTTHIKYKNRFIDYPFQKNIHQLSKKELIDCLYDLFAKEERNYNNFKEMLYTKFGKSIAEKFLIPYNSKLYACDLNSLDKDAMGRFFPYAEKEEIILNFKRKENGSYNKTFMYPKTGAISYINSVCKNLDMSKIRTNTGIISIDKTNKTARLSDDTIIKYDRIISTIPFPDLLEKAGIDYNKDIYNWNKVLVFNLGFNIGSPDIKSHWIYMPENKYCFYRVGLYNNILSQDRVSLYVEIGFSKSEDINPREWLKKVLDDLKLAQIITDKHILTDYESIIMDPAYVHISSCSNEDVRIKKELLAKNDIYSIGRYGSWCYCSIEDNIKEAQDLAQKLNTYE